MKRKPGEQNITRWHIQHISINKFHAECQKKKQLWLAKQKCLCFVHDLAVWHQQQNKNLREQFTIKRLKNEQQQAYFASVSVNRT